MSPWTVATTDAGERWDALRLPLDRGIALYEHLAADPDLLAALGPVVASARSDATYWLITTGTQPGAWPNDCRLLSRGSALVLPDDRTDPHNARWLHRPAEPGRLTGAVWLAAALNDHLTLEASMPTDEPPPLCTLCQQPSTGLRAPIDPRDPTAGIVDVSHEDCYQRLLDRPLALRHEGGR